MPNPLREANLDNRTKVFFPVDGAGSASAFIHDDGLSGEWLVSDFDIRKAQVALQWWTFSFRYTAGQLQTLHEAGDLITRYLTPYRYGAFFQVATLRRTLAIQ